MLTMEQRLLDVESPASVAQPGDSPFANQQSSAGWEEGWAALQRQARRSRGVVGRPLQPWAIHSLAVGAAGGQCPDLALGEVNTSHSHLEMVVAWAAGWLRQKNHLFVAYQDAR